MSSGGMPSIVRLGGHYVYVVDLVRRIVSTRFVHRFFDIPDGPLLGAAFDARAKYRPSRCAVAAWKQRCVELSRRPNRDALRRDLCEYAIHTTDAYNYFLSRIGVPIPHQP
jgi:hypothetical protein